MIWYISFDIVADPELLIYFGALYVFFTFSFAIRFSRSDLPLTRWQKLVHHVLIWVIPILWIIVLFILLKPLRKRRIDGTFVDRDHYW